MNGYYHNKFWERVAYHEAAHAILALNAGREFNYITINPANNLDGYVHGVSEYSNEAHAFENALIAAAGIVAERMKYGTHTEQDPSLKYNDVSMMTQMTKRAYPHNFELGCAKITETTHYILKVRWPAVEQIAKALLEKHTLTYNDVQQILSK